MYDNLVEVFDSRIFKLKGCSSYIQRQKLFKLSNLFVRREKDGTHKMQAINTTLFSLLLNFFLVFLLVVEGAGSGKATVDDLIPIAIKLHKSADHDGARQLYREMLQAVSKVPLTEANSVSTMRVKKRIQALLGISLCGTSEVDAAIPLLYEASIDKKDPVAASYLGGCYGFIARRIAQKVDKNTDSERPSNKQLLPKWENALENATRWFRIAIENPMPSITEPYPQKDFAQPIADSVRGLGDALLWLNRESEARKVFKRAADNLQIAHPFCRPVTFKPSKRGGLFKTGNPVYFLPNAMMRHVLDPIEKAFSLILEDYKAYEEHGSDQDLYRTESGGLHLGEDWKALPLLVNGKTSTKGCTAFPNTCSLLLTIPEVKISIGQAKFSKMAPGTRTLPHAGPSNARVRVHCGLSGLDGASIRVGTETRTWSSGKCFAFQESCEHEVFYNGTSQDRIVLLVDVANPLLDTFEDYKSSLLQETIDDKIEARLYKIYQDIKKITIKKEEDIIEL